MTSRRFVAPTWSTPEGREAIALSKRSTISAPAAFWAIERFRSKGIDLPKSVALTDGLWDVYRHGPAGEPWERVVASAALVVDELGRQSEPVERPQRPTPYFPAHTGMEDAPISLWWIAPVCVGIAALLGVVVYGLLRG